MAKKSSKIGKSKRAGLSEMTKAKNLYLEKMGEISDSQIARLVGCNRNTVKAWKEKGNWPALLADIQHAADKKTVERAATKIADQSEIFYDEIFAVMRLAGLYARKHMLQFDDHGRPIKDAQGQPMFRVGLTPNDVRNLISTMESCQRMQRLHTGQSTANNNNKISGEVVNRRPVGEEQFEKAVKKVLETGDAEAQDALLKMIESRQKLVEMAEAGSND